MPEYEPGAHARIRGEEVELAAERAVIAPLGLLDAMQVRVELFLLEERRAVDALQHLALLVAAPVGAGRVQQLEVLDARRVGHVRAAAEIDERAVGVRRDDLVLAAARRAARA